MRVAYCLLLVAYRLLGPVLGPFGARSWPRSGPDPWESLFKVGPDGPYFGLFEEAPWTAFSSSKLIVGVF